MIKVVRHMFLQPHGRRKKMDEQKRLILAVVLSIVVLVGYQAIFVKPRVNETVQPESQQAQQPVQVQEGTPAGPEQINPNISDYKSGMETPEKSERPENQHRNITVSTPLYNIVISEYGAAVRSFELKEFKETNAPDSPLKQLVSPDLLSGTFLLDLERSSVPDLKTAVYAAAEDRDQIALGQGTQNIEFVYHAPKGLVIKKVFTFHADSYLIDCDVVFQNGSSMSLNDSIMISTPGIFNEEVKKRSRFAFEGPAAFIDNEFQAIKPDDIKEKNLYDGQVEWTAFMSRYFMTAVMPEKTEGVSTAVKLRLAYENDLVTVDMVQPMDRLDPGKQVKYPFVFYLGPKSLSVLDDYDNSLRKAVNFGFFNILARPLLIIMNYIHAMIPNYGIAIILLTVFIKIVFWPLGTKSYKSMNEMKKVQPLMTQIREKYKNDKQKMNQEIMGLYKTYKVNPASGCLPMLVQMPIFFALYRMLYQAIELRHAPFMGWITDLAAPDRLLNFSFSIPMMQPPYGIPMLTLIMGASFLLQQKMTPTTGDPMQARMMMLMPIFMTVLFINFPAGLVLYMFVNNIISMGQQYYIQKKLA